jgi:DNA mismatch repair protein MutS2
MRTTSADLLEFDPLKQLLSRYVASPLGRMELEKVSPCTDRSELEQILSEVGEAMEYVQSASRPHPAARGVPVRIRFDSFADPTEAIHKLRIEGASLEAKEIYELTELLDRADDIRRLLASAAGRFPSLAGRVHGMGEFRSLVRDLIGKILPDGTVADDASLALGRLRRDIDRQRRLVQESLERFLRVHREEGLLQEEFVTIRNERFVVPVITGRQRRIEGVIHGSSGSGHTLFVEPLETIELNNELVRLTEEELREVHRILREMTASLREHEASIQATVSALGELELLFAKARFAADFDCSVPCFSAPSTRRLVLREARHPLLEDVLRRQNKRIVPLSLSLEGDCRTLLVSGPNTGGKTVTLKTVGLLALMAQAGLPVPCAEAEFPVFGQVLADIGDQQSIQESLSTFSAHICRVREMLEAADADSLVLLDELGRATDPEEGGALGMAVLENFRAAGAFTLASTHLLALKVYGAGTQGVVNGCMGFDDETLQPTYVLRLGVPGKSAGLEIAQRLGMSGALIRQAQSRLGEREQDVSRFLADLHRRLEEVTLLERELQEQKQALASRQEALAHHWERRESAKLKELERRCELVLEKFEVQARETLEKIVADAEQKKTVGAASRRVAKVKRELREEIETTVLSTQDEARQGELVQPKTKIAEGVRVRLKGVREPARVRRKLAGDLIEVEAGFMRLQVPADDVLEVLPAAETGPSLPRHVSFKPSSKAARSVQEINVIGQHAEEACAQVEKFLDDTVLAEVTRVRIIHGHGMGVLRRAIADLLAKNPNVERFYSAEPHEGGTGATIVELKE